MDLYGRNLLKEIDLTAGEFGYLDDTDKRHHGPEWAAQTG